MLLQLDCYFFSSHYFHHLSSHSLHPISFPKNTFHEILFPLPNTHKKVKNTKRKRERRREANLRRERKQEEKKSKNKRSKPATSLVTTIELFEQPS
jgi:hypothetical protein